MSFLSGVGSFFHKVGASIEKLFGNGNTNAKIQATLKFVAPLVTGIVAMVDPAAAPLATEVSNEVQADFGLVSTVVAAGTAAPGTPGSQQVVTALNSVKSNIGGLLNAAEVKNSAKAAEIQNAANTIISEVEAIISELAPPPATSATSSTTVTT